DAVVVSTPDHTHFHPSMAALARGKHLYCEKPMAHSVWEVRQLTNLAAEMKLATQLGVQRHTHDNVHRVVELIHAGAIGQVRECHAWVGGDRGMPKRPKDKRPVPAHLKWDLWLGPAEKRPYSPEYCPYKWRFWWDFGTGETGNWGCHILDIPFWALQLKHSTWVHGEGPPADPQLTPKSMTTRFEFPARDEFPPVTLHWYHTKKGPRILHEYGLPHFGSGVLFVGEKGMLLCDFGKRKLFPESKFADFEPPPKTIPDSPGFHKEWTLACKGGKPATCNFDYSGPMTETLLLDNLAYRAGESFDWDAEQLQVPGSAKAAEYIRTPFRRGWGV
ncbi:MAG: Gfo/Idh/MocA family oxidoreductase, partial [Longimicrobiales bacterium]